MGTKGTDFFDGLGETLTRTAKEIGERAEQIYEAQKLRNKISGEERIVDKVMIDMGNLIYRRYESGEELDGELLVLCEEIRQHMNKISEYKGAAADMKGQKICLSCGKSIDKEVSYCPYCGTACPVEEPEAAEEENEDDVISETWEENFPEEGEEQDSEAEKEPETQEEPSAAEVEDTAGGSEEEEVL